MDQITKANDLRSAKACAHSIDGMDKVIGKGQNKGWVTVKMTPGTLNLIRYLLDNLGNGLYSDETQVES